MTTTDSADASAAPDLPTAVVGWRQWRLEFVAGRARLASPVRWARWEPGTPMESRCPNTAHRPPGDGCGCGIYAARELLTAAQAASGPSSAMVIGRVALWGEVVQGERGWRAARGYPELLLVDPSVTDTVIKDLTSDYGVAVRRCPVALSFLRALPNAEQVRRHRAVGRRRQDRIIEVLERHRALATRVDADSVDEFLRVTKALFVVLRGASLARLPRDVVRVSLGCGVPPALWCVALHWPIREFERGAPQVLSVLLLVAVLVGLVPAVLGMRRGLRRFRQMLAIRWPGGGDEVFVAMTVPLVMASLFQGVITVGMVGGHSGPGWSWVFCVIPAMVVVVGLVAWRCCFPPVRAADATE